MRSLLSQAAPHPGTPGFMSPEQLDSRNYLSSSSDVYALGLVLFEALTGRAYSNLRPGTRLLDLRSDVPEWLDELLGTMLAENPKQRPWDGEEVAGLLRGRIEENARQLEEAHRRIEEEQRVLLKAEESKRRAEEERARLAEEERIHREAAERAHREAEERKQKEAEEKAWKKQQERESDGKKSILPLVAIGIISLLGVVVIGMMIMLLNRGPVPSEQTPEMAESQPASANPNLFEPTKTDTAAVPELKNQIITDEKGVKMALVPAGEYQMGSENGESDEKPIHTVYLDDYYIDVYEATNSLYEQCVLAGVCSKPGISSSPTRYSYYGNADYYDYPVIYVNWDQASELCAWRGARLPTEAEWEKAARGGLEGMDYPWGDEAPVCTKGAMNGANFASCKEDDTMAVGSFNSNYYGLYDMSGNVWEWVQDWYEEDYYSRSASSHPTGPASGETRVVRGGSWRYVPGILRVAFRDGDSPVAQSNGSGFRCSRSP